MITVETGMWRFEVDGEQLVLKIWLDDWQLPELRGIEALDFLEELLRKDLSTNYWECSTRLLELYRIRKGL
jgi:hypothetical protein